MKGHEKTIFYKFVDKNLFTLGHVTKFVYKSHDKIYARIIQGNLCLEKAYKVISAVCLHYLVT